MTLPLDTVSIELRKVVRDVRKAPKETPRFAVFDHDNTLIYNDIMEATLAYLCEHKLLRNFSLVATDKDYHAAVFQEYHRMLADGRAKEAYRFAAKTLAGFTIREMKGVVEETLKQEGTKLGEHILYDIKIAKGIDVNPQIASLTQLLQQDDIQIWIVSASPRAVIEPMRDHYFPGCSVIAINQELVRGKLTDKVIEPAPIYDGKVKCIQRDINRMVRPILAVGDSMNDRAMLEYAHIPVVVDRGNSLAAFARERHWHILF